MGRGGLGARKSAEERFERSTRYHLIGVKAGSPVVECLDRYRRWELGYRKGIILRNSGAAVTVQWEGEDEFTFYTGEDARYKVDTNLWRIGENKGRSPLDALTTRGAAPSIEASAKADNILTKEKKMAEKDQEPKKAAAEPKRDDNGNVERKTLTAKQVATRIGTDAKTLRKFFRTDASTVEAVGQGGRYEFDADDLPKIKKEFDAWNSNKTTRTPRKKGDAGKPESRSNRVQEVEIEDEEDIELEDEPELNFDDEEESDEEPTEDALAELEDDNELEDIDLDNEEEDDEEEDDEEGHTEEELKKMTLPRLRSLAEGDYDLEISGMKKAEIIAAILKHEKGA